jgi:titin
MFFTAPDSSGGNAITTYSYSLNGGAYTSIGGTTSPFLIAPLTNGVSYTVLLRAENAAGSSVPSSSRTATPYTIPDKPIIASLVSGDSSLNMFFNALANNGGNTITAYSYSLNGGSYTTIGTTSPYKIAPLTNGVSYTVLLRAENAAGISIASDPISGTPYTVPTSPTIDLLIPINDTINVQINPIISNGGNTITDYYYNINGSATYNYLGAFGTTRYPITGLTRGVTYTLTVTAKNSAGNSSPSASKSTFLSYQYDYLYTVAGNVSTTSISNSSTSISTITSTIFNTPGKIAFDSLNNLYVTDTNNHVVRVIPATSGTLYGVNVIVGNTYIIAGTANTSGTTITNGVLNTSCTLNSPYGVAFDTNNNMFISDTNNHVVRVISKNGGGIYGVSTTANQTFVIAGTGVAGTSTTTTTTKSYDGVDSTGFTANTTLDMSSNIFNTAISDDMTKMVISKYGNYADGNNDVFQYRTRSTASNNWGTLTTFTLSSGTIPGYNGGRYVSMTPDGTRVVLSIPTKAWYYTDWNGSNAYGPLTAISTSTSIFIGIGITADKSRVFVGWVDGKLSFYDRSGNGYGTTVNISTNTSLSYNPIAVTRDGSRVVGRNTSIGVTLYTRSSSPTTTTTTYTENVIDDTVRAYEGFSFSPDGKILFTCVTGNTTASVWYAVWNASASKYDKFTAISTSYIPSSGTMNMRGVWATFPSTGSAILYSTMYDGTTSKLYNTTVTYTITNIATNIPTTTPTLASLRNPRGIALDASNNLYIADTGNHAIKVISQAGAQIYGLSTVANNLYTLIGTDNNGGTSGDNVDISGSLLNTPTDMIFDSSLNLYLSDTNNNVVRVVSKISGPIFTKTVVPHKMYIVAGTASTSITSGAGTDVSATVGGTNLYLPRGLALDGSNNLFIADSGSHTIRVVSNKNGKIGNTTVIRNNIYTIAGTLNTAYVNGQTSTDIALSSAKFKNPYSFAYNTVNTNMYISDSGTNSVRQINYIPPPTSPNPPIINSFIGGNASVVLTFSPPLSDGGSPIITYYYALQDGSSPISAYTSLGGTPLTSYAINNVTPGNTYTLSLIAENILGNSSARTATAVPYTLPSKPIINSITSGNQSLTVSLNTNVYNGGNAIVTYFYSTDNGSTYRTTGGNTNPYTINTLLTNGTTYDVVFISQNSGGNSSPSDPVSAIPYTTPSAPINMYLVSDDRKLFMYFTEPTSNGGNTIIDYNISLNGGSSYASIGSTSPYTISPLTNGTPTTVLLRARNAAGNSPTATATATPYTTPDTPVLTSIIGSNSTLSVSLSSAVSNGGSAYTTYFYSTDGGETYTSSNNVVTNPYSITGLTNGNVYTVKLITRNQAGNSNPSNALTGIPYTVPSTPSITSLSPGNNALTANVSVSSTGGNAITSYNYNIQNNTLKYNDLNQFSNSSSDNITGSVKISSIAVKDDNTRIIYGMNTVNASDYAVKYMYKEGDTWTTKNLGGTNTMMTAATHRFTQVDMTSDGNTIFINGYSNAQVYYSTWDSVKKEYSSIQSLDGTTASGRFYSGLSTKSDGSRLVVSFSSTAAANDFTIRTITKSGSTYSTDTTNTISSTASASGYVRTRLNRDGSRLVYASYIGGLIYLSKWDGSKYPAGTAIFDANSRRYADFAFSYDSNILLALNMYSGSTTSNLLWYSKWSDASSSYLSLSTVATSTIGISNQLSNEQTLAIAWTYPSDKIYVGRMVPDTDSTIYVANGSFNRTIPYNANASFSTSPPHTFSGLTNGVPYSVTVVVQNAAGSSSVSATSIGTPSTTTNPPTLNSLVPGNNTITVNLTAPVVDVGVSPITAYYYNLNNSATYYLLGLAGQTQYTISSNVTNGISYIVSVIAENGAGNSSPSNTLSTIPYTIPSAPNLTNIDSGDTTLKVTFDSTVSNGGNAITGYVFTVGNTSTSYTVTANNGLTAYTYYKIRVVTLINATNSLYTRGVQLFDSLGNSLKTSYTGYKFGTYTVIGDGGTLQAYFENPGTYQSSTTVIPANIYFKLGSATKLSKAQFHQNAGYSNNNAKKWELYGSNTLSDFDNGDSSTSGWSFISSVENLTYTSGLSVLTLDPNASALDSNYSYTIYGLVNGISYTISAISKNFAGSSSSSNQLTGVPYGAPGAPSLDTLVSGNTKLVAYITAPSFIGGSSLINYYYNLNGDATYYYLGAVGSASYDISGLTNGNSYTVTIKVDNVVGNSVASSSKTAIPYTFPNAPSLTALISGNATLTANVTAPTVNGGNAVSKYYYTLDSGISYYYLGQVGQPQYDISGLDNGNSYTVAIIAENSAGNSQLSANLTAIPYTIPGIPTLDLLIGGNTKLTANVIAPKSTGGNAITTYYYNLNGSATYSYLGPVNAGPYDISGLNNGNLYAVTVKAENAAGNSNASASLSATPYTIPDPPTLDSLISGDAKLTANVIAPAWNGGNAITNYYYTLDSGNSYSYLGIVGAGPYDITGLARGNSYTLSVIVENIAGNSRPSNSITTVAYTIPDAPSLTALIPGNATLFANITAPTNNGGNAIKKYYYTLDSGVTYYYLGPAGQPQYTITDLSNGNSYTVSVVVENDAGNSSPSGNLTAIPYTVPDVPIFDLLIGGNTKITANVIAPAWNGGNAIINYYYNLDGDATYYYLGPVEAGPYDISGLTNGNSYTVTITVDNSAGNSNPTPSRSAIPYTVPDAPSLTALISGNAQLTANITEPYWNGGNAISSYYYTLNNGLSYVYLGAGGQSQYIISNLFNGDPYTISVIAENVAGNSTISGNLTAIPYTVPDIPTLNGLVSGNTIITATVSAPVWNGGNAITTYYYSLNGSTIYYYLGPVGSATYDISGLVNGNSYTVAIVVENTAGNSRPSLSLSAIPYTIPDAPTLDILFSRNTILSANVIAPAWNGGNAITSYYYSLDGSTTYSYLGAAGAGPYNITGLTNGNSYTVAIIAENAAGNSQSSSGLSAIPYTVPDVPTLDGLVSGNTILTATVIAPEWNGGNVITSYYYSLNNSETYYYLGPVGSATYDISGLTNGNSYTVAIIAENTAGNSQPSNTRSAIPYTVPDSPTLNGLVSQNTILITNVIAPAWNGGNEITTYYYNLDGSDTYYYLGDVGFGPYNITGLTNGNSYTVSVVVKNTAGNSQPSNSLSAIPYTIPDVPTLDLLIGGNTNLTANVIAPAWNGGNAITSYYYTLDNGFNYYHLGPVGAGPYDISGLTNGASYNVSIIVENTAGNSRPSTSVSAVPYTIPDVPTLDLLISGNTKLTANVIAPAWNGGNAITSYYYNLDGSATYSYLGPFGAGQYDISGLVNGNSYTVSVLAENNAGNSRPSSSLSAIPYTVPDAPEITNIRSGTNRLFLNVAAPVWNGGNTITKYYFTLNGGASYTYLGEVGQPEYEITGLPNGRLFTIAVVVENNAGNSLPSSNVIGIPYATPGAPTLNTVVPGNTTITATITAPVDNGGNAITTYFYNLNGSSTYYYLGEVGLASYDISGLTNGNSYTIAVTVKNAGGNSSPSNSLTTIPYTNPDSPTLDILVAGNTKLTANVIAPAWDGGNAITTYYYNLNGDATYYYLGEVGLGSYDIEGLTNGNSYTVSVVVKNTAGNSSPSTSRTAIPYTNPDSPTLDILVSGNTKLTANVIAPAWNGGNAITTYYYNLNGDATYYYLGQVGLASYDISGLDNGNSYTVSVVVENSAGNSQPSSGLTAIPYTIPDAPSITDLLSGNTTLTANITAPAWNGGNAITKYYYTLDSGVTYYYLGAVGQPQYTIRDLSNGNSYTVSVIVENIAGNSSPSASFTKIPYTIPDSPILDGLTSENMALTANVIAPAWNGGNAITSYYYSTDNIVYNYLGEFGQNSYTINGLTNGRNYRIWITAQNSAGSSIPSNTLTGVPYTTPNVPSLTTLTSGNNSLTATIDPPTEDGGNPIKRYFYSINGSSYRYLGNANASPYIISDLSNGTSYTIRVIGENNSGNSSPSNSLTAIPYTIPDVPTLNLLVSGNARLTANVIAPAWNGGNAITEYYYNIDGSATYYYLGNVNENPYTIPGLTNGNSYAITVTAKNTAGNSRPSNSLSAIPYTVPSRPTINTLISKNEKLTATIIAPTLNGGNAITKYYYTINGGSSYAYLGPVGQSEYDISPLINGREYQVSVIVENVAGNSNPSIPFLGIPYTIPGAPTINTLVSGNNQFIATITPPALNGGTEISTYYYTLNGGSTYSFLGFFGDTQYIISGVYNGTPYTVELVARNAAGDSPKSNALSAIPYTVPNVPTLDSLVSGNTKLTANVIAPSFNGGNAITSYYYNLNGSATYYYLGAVGAGPYDISGLTNGNAYTVSVIAKNIAGNSSPSSSLTAIPYTIPSSPSITALISGNTTLTANVTAPESTGGNAIVSYYYNLNGSATFLYLGDVGQSQYIIPGLDNGNAYTVSIKVNNVAGNSQPSTSFTAIPYTIPDVPSFTALLSGNTTLTANITAPTWNGGNAITKYYYTLDSGASYYYLGAVGQPQYTISGLTNGNSYTVSIVVENTAGNSNPTASLTAIPYTVPDVPTLDLLVSGNTILTANVIAPAWNGGNAITSYYYNLNGSSTYYYLGQVGAGPYNISGLTNGNAYTVSVIAKNIAGNSRPSSDLTAIPYTIPDVPTITAVLSGNTTLTANITAPAWNGGNAITKYYYTLDSGASYYYLGAVGQPQYTISGLNNGNSYTLSVVVENVAGNSQPTPPITAIPYTVPDVPTLDLLISGNTKLTANVIAPAWNGGNAMTSYYYSLNGSATYYYLGQVDAGPYDISGLTNGTTYTVQVVVKNTAGNSQPSNVLSKVPYTTPDSPYIDIIQSRNTTLSANIIAPAWNGGAVITTYYYTINGGLTYLYLGSVGQSSYTISGLVNGNTYSIEVVVENIAGNSNPSNTVSAIPYTVPNRPTLNSLIGGNTILTANVIAPAVNGGNAITEYYYNLNGSTTYSYLGAFGAGPYTIPNLNNGGTYIVTILAKNVAGNSQPSISRSAIPYTVPDVPTLDLLVGGNTKITANVIAPAWNGGNAMTKYYYNLNGNSTYYYLGLVDAGPYDISGLNNGNAYTVTVKVENTAGNSQASSSLTAIPYTIPNEPTINALISGNTTLTADISAPEWNGGNAITAYYYTLDNGDNYSYLGAFGQSQYTITGLENGTEYTVKVLAENTAGNSVLSASRSAIPYTIPNVPTLSVLVSGNSKLTATIIAPVWNGGNAITTYYYNLNGSATYYYLGPVGASTYDISGVDNGNSYTVRVIVENTAGNSNPSNARTAIPYTVPNKPTIDLLSSGDTLLTAYISEPVWNGGNAITKYYYTLDSGVSYSYLGPVGQVSYNITGLTNGNTYTVAVIAENLAGNSIASDTAQAVSYTIPDPPSIDALVSGNTTLTANVIAPAWNGGTAVIEYYYTLDNGSTYFYLGPVGQSQYTIPGLINGALYDVSITAKNLAGNSILSNIASAIPYTIPDAPVLTSLISGNTSLTMNFNLPVFDGGNAIFNYNYSLDGINYISINSLLLDYTIPDLVNGNAYTVWVRAENTAGNSSPSNTLSAIPYTVPDSPILETLTPGIETIDVSFSVPEWNGGNAITTYYYSLNGGVYRSIGQTTSPYTIPNVVNGVLYGVSFIARNARGNSAPSNVLYAQPYRIPDAPTQLTLTPGTGSITMNFTQPVFNGGNAIIDYQYSINDSSYVRMGQQNNAPYVISSLENGIPYTIYLQAINARGNSIASVPATTTPFRGPDAPTLFDVISGDATIDISFSVPVFNGGSVITDYRYSLDGSNGTFYSMGQSTNTVYRVPNLTNGNTYLVSVKATNARGHSNSSNEIAVIPYAIPDPPTIDYIVDDVESSTVYFIDPVFDGGNRVTNYRYSTDAGTTFSLVSPPQTTSPIIIRSLQNAETYSICLEAVNARGNSAPSNMVPSTPYRIPDAPTITSVRPDIRELTVFFTSPTFSGGRPITNYRYSIDEQTTFVNFYPAKTTSPYTISNLINGQSYTVYLEAINIRGNSTISNAITATPYTIPEAPVVNALIPGIASIDVSFSEPIFNGGNTIIAYYYSTDQGASFVSVGATPTQYTILYLENGVSYDVIMKAENARGNSNVSAIQTTIPYRVPDSPRELRLIPEIGSITASFLPPTFNGGNVISNYYYSIDNTVFVLIPQSPFVIPDLQNGTSYTVSVYAENARGNSAPATAETIPYRVPNPPSIVDLVAGDTYIDISFSAPAFNGGNAIVNYQYSTSDNSQNYIVFNPPQTVSPFRINNLENGQPYTIWLQAINARGSSENSNDLTTTPYTVPDSPTLDQLIAGNTYIDVYFSPPTFNGGNTITDYTYSLNGDTDVSMEGITSPYRITGLTNGQLYTVSVKATNARGSSIVSSNESSAIPYTISNPPILRSLTAGINAIDVSFSAPTFDGGRLIIDYQYSINNGTLVSIGNMVSVFTIPDLSNGVAYAVRMVAVNIAGNSEFSDTFTTTPFDVPDPPTIIELVPGNRVIDLSFSAPAWNGGSTITNYQYSIDEGSLIPINTLLSPYTIYDLSNGRLYSITLVSVNARGNSSVSNMLTATPRTLPDRPTILTITPGDHTIEVFFAPPEWNGGSPITSYRYIIDNEVYTLESVSNTVFTIFDLNNGQEYDIAMTAINVAGESVRSDIVSVIPYGVPNKPEIIGYIPGNRNIILQYSELVPDGGKPITSFRYSINGGPFIFNAVALEGSIVVDNLVNGQTYDIRIRAVNIAGVSSASDPFTFIVYTTPPPPIIENITPNQLSLTVNIRPPINTSGSAITGYRYIYEPDGLNYTDVSGLTFTIPGLQGGVEYSVRVLSVNIAGGGDLSDPSYASPIVPAFNTIPDAPTIDYIQDGSGYSIVYYSLGVDRGSAIQTVFYTIGEYTGIADVSGIPGVVPGLNDVVVDGRNSLYLSFEINNLVNGIVYEIRMFSLNEYGLSLESKVAYSFPHSTQLLMMDERTITPELSSGIPKFGMNIRSYSIYPGEDIFNPYANTLEEDNTFMFDFTEEDSDRSIIMRTVPSAPTIDYIDPGQSSLTVNIRPPVNNSGAITGYRYSYDPSGLTYTDVSGSTFTITGLQGGTYYFVRVKSVNALGESIPSNPYYVSTYTPTYNTIPDAPTIQYIQDGDGYSMVYYTLGMDNGSAIRSIYFTISEYAGPVDLFARPDEVPALPETVDGKIPVYLSFVLENLVNGVVYAIRMYSLNEYGLSLESEVAYCAPYTSPSAPIVTQTLAKNNVAVFEYIVPDNGGRYITDVFYSVNGSSFLSNGPNNTLQLTQLLNKNIYTVRFVAKNQAGLLSPISEEVSVEPYYSSVDLPLIKQSNTINQSLSKKGQYALTVRINKGKRRFIG